MGEEGLHAYFCVLADVILLPGVPRADRQSDDQHPPAETRRLSP